MKRFAHVVGVNPYVGGPCGGYVYVAERAESGFGVVRVSGLKASGWWVGKIGDEVGREKASWVVLKT